MRATRAIGVTVTVLGVLAASGCSGGSEDDAATTRATSAGALTTTATSPTSTPSVPATSTTSSTPASASSSKGTAAGAPGVPEPARQHTKAGAKAFAEYYIGLVNSAGQRPNVGVLEPLGLQSCKSCDNYEGTVRYFVKHKQRFDGPQYRIKTAQVAGYSEIAVFVKVVASEPAVNIVGSTGKQIKQYPAIDKSISVFELSWKHGWRVATIKGE